MSFVQLQTNRRSNNEDNLIPLINVVFLMLIFFMVAGVIRETDKAEIIHPTSISTQSLEKQSLAKQVVTLVVQHDASMVLEDVSVNSETMVSRLKSLLKESVNSENLYLVLRVDSRLSAEDLHIVLKAVRAAGLLKVQLLTEREGRV